MKTGLTILGVVVILLVVMVMMRPRFLWFIEGVIATLHPVEAIEWREFKERMAEDDSSHYILFDVREREEFEVSHLAAAIHVEPATTQQEFLDRFQDDIKNKHLIFYCSVGYRSSRLLEEVKPEALRRGAISANNLRGGIFRWFNEDNVVVDAHGVANAVHPYDRVWSFLVRKRVSREN